MKENKTEFTYSDEVTCFSYFDAKPKCRAQLIEALLALVEPTRQESGCLQYDLIADAQEENFFIMVEKFVSYEALEAHQELPCIKHFVENLMQTYCEKVVWHEGQEVLSVVK